MNYSKSNPKNRMLAKILAFIVILSLFWWTIPVSGVFGNAEKDLTEAYDNAVIALDTAQDEAVKANDDLESAKLIAAEAEATLKAASEKLDTSNKNFVNALSEVEKLKEKLALAIPAASIAVLISSSLPVPSILPRYEFISSATA